MTRRTRGCRAPRQRDPGPATPCPCPGYHAGTLTGATDTAGNRRCHRCTIPANDHQLRRSPPFQRSRRSEGEALTVPRPPGDDPERDTVLEHRERITSVDLSTAPSGRGRTPHEPPAHGPPRGSRLHRKVNMDTESSLFSNLHCAKGGQSSRSGRPGPPDVGERAARDLDMAAAVDETLRHPHRVSATS